MFDFELLNGYFDRFRLCLTCCDKSFWLLDMMSLERNQHQFRISSSTTRTASVVSQDDKTEKTLEAKINNVKVLENLKIKIGEISSKSFFFFQKKFSVKGLVVCSVSKPTDYGFGRSGFDSQAGQIGAVLPKARHRCNVTSELCSPGTKLRRWARHLLHASM